MIQSRLAWDDELVITMTVNGVGELVTTVTLSGEGESIHNCTCGRRR